MTVKEFYEKIHGNYNTIFNLFSDDSIILIFVKQFASDPSFNELMEAVMNENVNASFEAAHKLKGLAANLAFSELFKNVSVLLEQLRTQEDVAEPLLLQKVCESYRLIIEEIENFESGGIEK